MALAIGILVLMTYFGSLRLKNLILIIFTALSILFILPDEQKERFSEMGEDNTSQSRLLYWEKGLEMANEYPAYGVGFYSFPLYFQDNYSHLLDSNSYLGARAEVAHNSLVQVASTMGYIGCMLYLLMHTHCLYLSKKTRALIKGKAKNSHNSEWLHSFSISLNVSVLTYFIGAFFMSVAFYPFIYLLLMLTQCTYNATQFECLPINKKKAR